MYGTPYSAGSCDNFGGHGLYSAAAVAQALTTWMPYA